MIDEEAPPMCLLILLPLGLTLPLVAMLQADEVIQ